MTLIGALHNISRSLGCTLLLASSDGKMMALSFIGGELVLYFAYKIVRRDLWYWPRLEGPIAIIISFLGRAVIKVLVDFSGLLHAR